MGDSSGANRAVRLLRDRFAVCRFPPDGPLPAWLFHAEAHVFSLTRTPDELSVVCPEDDLPPSIEHCERGWRMLLLQGPIPFEEVGVLAGLLTPLAAAKVPVFAISTFDTDALMVKEQDLERALEALGRTHGVRRP